MRCCNIWQFQLSFMTYGQHYGMSKICLLLSQLRSTSQVNKQCVGREWTQRNIKLWVQILIFLFFFKKYPDFSSSFKCFMKTKWLSFWLLSYFSDLLPKLPCCLKHRKPQQILETKRYWQNWNDLNKIWNHLEKD